MITVLNYEIKQDGDTIVEMPYGSEILSAKEFHRSITVWALVDTESTPIQRKFHVYKTGKEIDRKDIKHLTYIDTIEDYSESFVWHVFEYQYQGG